MLPDEPRGGKRREARPARRPVNAARGAAGGLPPPAYPSPGRLSAAALPTRTTMTSPSASL